MKNFALFATLTLLSTHNPAMAAGAFTCASQPNPTGGTVSVSIGEEVDGQASVELFAQGGRAHFVSQVGPFTATVTHEPDGSFYSFTDSFNQKVTVAVFTSAFGGKLQTTASTDFGVWKSATMICQ